MKSIEAIPPNSNTFITPWNVRISSLTATKRGSVHLVLDALRLAVAELAFDLVLYNDVQVAVVLSVRPHVDRPLNRLAGLLANFEHSPIGCFELAHANCDYVL